MATSDDFFERLRTLNQQARRLATVEGEILVEFRRTKETFALADSATVVTRGPQYIWTTTPGPTQIIWGEWKWQS